MLASSHYHILLHVTLLHFLSSSNRAPHAGRIPEFLVYKLFTAGRGLLLSICIGCVPVAASRADDSARFLDAWQAASRGDRAAFQQGLADLQGYLLYPYLRYEDLRDRRNQVPDDEMALFLDAHRDWAFAAALEKAWWRALARNQRWTSLLNHAAGASEADVRCAYVEARIRSGASEGLLQDAQDLWAVGHSQPEDCDPVFAWLRQQGGITPELAWTRIGRAMEERQPRLTRYLARFLPEAERVWADRWYQQDQGGYRRLDQAKGWPDSPYAQDITAFGIARLARSDADRAARIYYDLEPRIAWPEVDQAELLREIALWSAVSGSPDTIVRMQAVPPAARDDNLLEWWARAAISAGNWSDLLAALDQLSEESRGTARWRYWRARALTGTGNPEAGSALLAQLAAEANFYAFLAADLLAMPYSLCPEEPVVPEPDVTAVAALPGIARALELRRLAILNWARAEWSLAVRGLDREGLRAAAAVAVRENWPDMAIFALGDSGDQRWYEWRFPLSYEAFVITSATAQGLDPSWVMGLMRSESAMAADALSAVGARGLMQVMPDTARLVAGRYGLRYTGSEQLLSPEDNIRFGTAYMRDLLTRFGGNPVLVSGAYNAGPGAVKRWLGERQIDDPVAWIENLPYRETREYIPRVLAFATLYDWRLQRPVARISTRMPAFDSSATSGTIQGGQTAEVVCHQSG